MEIRLINQEEVAEAVALLSGVVEDMPSYISHGEIQMGVADDANTLNASRHSIWRQYLLRQSERGGILIAVDGDEFCGFVCSEVSSDGGEKFGVICDLCVRKERRRSGIGTALANAAVKRFQSLGVQRVFLESGIHNLSAHEFFARLGFEPVSKVFMRPI